MCNNVIFQDQNKTFLFEFLYKVDKYFTYEIYISTSEYSGKCNFCIPEDMLKNYVKRISKIMINLSGEITIEDCESDAYLKVYFENKRELYLRGQIGGSYEDNNLKFRVDQTILLRLKNELLYDLQST